MSRSGLSIVRFNNIINSSSSNPHNNNNNNKNNENTHTDEVACARHHRLVRCIHKLIVRYLNFSVSTVLFCVEMFSCVWHCGMITKYVVPHRVRPQCAVETALCWLFRSFLVFFARLNLMLFKFVNRFWLASTTIWFLLKWIERRRQLRIQKAGNL